MALRYGDTGPGVLDLQEWLAELGHLSRPRLIDGVPTYDRLIDTTIRRIQRDAGIAIDGIYGPQTEQALDALERMDPRQAAAVKLDRLPDGYQQDAASWKVLARALHYQDQGAREMEGNNRGHFVDHFFDTEKGVKNDTRSHGEWCAAVVFTCAIEALGRDALPFAPFVWTPAYVRAINTGVFFWSSQGADLEEAITGARPPEDRIDYDFDPSPGDAFLQTHFTIDTWERKRRSRGDEAVRYFGHAKPGHVGLIHHRERTGQGLLTIEGNLGRYPAYFGPYLRRADDLDILGYFKWSESTP